MVRGKTKIRRRPAVPTGCLLMEALYLSESAREILISAGCLLSALAVLAIISDHR